MAAKKSAPVTLDDIIKRVNKSAGTDIIGRGIPKRDYERIPFTSPRMNYCTYGGIPKGRLVEFYGEEHGGKTATALDIVANFQNMESAKDNPAQVAYIDTENTLDVVWSSKLGVDVDNLILLQPESQSAEEIMQVILDMIGTGQIGLVVLDSIAAMVSEQEMDKDLSERTYAGISQPLTVFGRKAEMLCKQTNCTLIGINQIRDDLGAMWGGAVKTPGGRAWRHLCSVRMQFTRGPFIDAKGAEIKRTSDSPAGNIVLMSMTKNKTCPANRRGGFYTINYSYGIDYLRDLIDVAEKYDVIHQSGSWFSLINPDTGEILAEKLHGMSDVRDFLGNEENEPVLTRIEEIIAERI